MRADGLGSAREPVNKHRTLVESMDSIQFEDFFSASFIDSFRGMHNEGQIGAALAKFVARSGSKEGECAQRES